MQHKTKGGTPRCPTRIWKRPYFLLGLYLCKLSRTLADRCLMALTEFRAMVACQGRQISQALQASEPGLADSDCLQVQATALRDRRLVLREYLICWLLPCYTGLLDLLYFSASDACVSVRSVLRHGEVTAMECCGLCQAQRQAPVARALTTWH
jgi:hypothetical protein